MIQPLEDLRYSIRGFLKNPMFTFVALASLALGIGANTAVFSLMDQALLRSLPVKQPDQLVLFQAPGPRRGSIDTSYDDKLTFSYPMYKDFHDANLPFDGVMARFPVGFSMSWHGETDRLHGDLVTGNFFDVLGVHAVIGRTLTQDDDKIPGGHPLVVLSYGFWKRRFGADPSVLNQSITLNSHPMTIIGVTGPGFRGVGTNEAPDVFVPMMMRAAMTPGVDDLDKRRSMWLNVFGRLKRGVPAKQAETAINTFWRPILEMEAKDMGTLSQSTRTAFLNRHLNLLPAGKGISVRPDGFNTAMEILMGMVGLLLLIACANVANLLIARATARQREIGIRLAIGASRARLIRQLLLESMLLAVAGGLLGVFAAISTSEALLRLMPEDPSMEGLSGQLDIRVFLFSLGLSILTGLLFGLVPALQGTKTELASTLKDQASGVVGGFGGLRLRKGLVITQVALSLVLLFGSGLFARSLYNAKSIDAGFHTDHLISFAIQPSFNGYSQERIQHLVLAIQEEIGKLPGVQSASMAEITLLSGDNEISTMDVEGYHSREDENMGVNLNHVGTGFFRTVGLSLLNGRDITAGDGPTAPKVALVNQTFANRFFADGNPLGRHLKFHGVSAEVIGVVKDGKMGDLREKKQPFAFVPTVQFPVNRTTFYARTAQDPSAAVQMIRQVVRRQDPNLPIFSIKSMDQQIDELLFMDRLVAALSATFGILATLLAAVGLYGVMAFMVVRRTREIGIRMALGANRKEVLRLVMKEVVLLSVAGIGIAMVASLALGRMIQSQLLGVSGTDPLVLFAATFSLFVVAMLAGFIPAMRASRVDPLSALRYE